MHVVGLKHVSNGFDDLLSNQITTPEITVNDTGRELRIHLSSEGSTEARLDVYIANSLGHHLPGRIFSSIVPITSDEKKLVSLKLLETC